MATRMPLSTSDILPPAGFCRKMGNKQNMLRFKLQMQPLYTSTPYNIEIGWFGLFLDFFSQRFHLDYVYTTPDRSENGAKKYQNGVAFTLLRNGFVHCPKRHFCRSETTTLSKRGRTKTERFVALRKHYLGNISLHFRYHSATMLGALLP